ncbi:polysaccharide pyruvyl transferase family protein [Hahella ganghwensis]|uniref:polysaccharide pyruvyl transferase family protein n=1 Tax=Hahella ganghwensis TaxID=286420 RepID=UPI00037BFCF9|nr:polysaccharide pyruvyl transferase family protein [Hahella ganghwensis]
MMKKILIYGFFGIENAGNEAMLKAFCEPIRTALGNDQVEFVVASRHPNANYDKTYGVRTIPNFEHSNRELAAGRWLRSLNPDDSGEYLAFVKEVASSDLVVLGPGQFLVETGTAGMLKGALGQALAVVSACLLTHTPVYGLALACEDLKSPWAKLVVQRLLPALSSLTFRDPKSPKNLNDAGIAIPEHAVLGDLALAGQPADADKALALFSEERIPERKGPRLAVALRNIYWLGIDQDAHRQKVAEVLADWLAQEDRDVVMIPQNVYDVDGRRDDDRLEAELTCALLPESLKSRVYRVQGKHEAAAIEAIYGQCDVTLSTRLHGSVFSCKQGTPPVMLTFMDKTRGFFSRIEHPECMLGLESSANDISTLLESFLQRRDALSQSLLTKVAEIRKTSSEYSQRALKLLEQESSERKNWAAGLF